MSKTAKAPPRGGRPGSARAGGGDMTRKAWELTDDRYTFSGRRVLVTGAAGTVGFEIVRQLLAEHAPALVRLFDQNESGLFFADQTLRAALPDINGQTRLLMGDVRDRERLIRAFQGIDVVIHCAGLKSPGLCDYNPFEAVLTNLIGVQNVIAAAIAAGVERVVGLSGTLAANPVGVLGATQLMAERLLSTAHNFSGTPNLVFSAVRFGEVLWSGADLVQTLREQILGGEPIVLPGPDASRFVLGLGDAARLVLAAGLQAQGGEVFVVKMPAMRLMDLAQTLAGRLTPGQPPRFQIARRDPLVGDRLYDELVSESELPQCVDAGDFVVVLPLAREVAPGLRRVLHAPRSDQQVPLTPGGLEAVLRESGALP